MLLYSGAVAAGVANTGLSATSNSIVGYFAGGASPTNTTVKYTFSNDVRTAGTNTSAGRGMNGAVGNATVGIFTGNYGAGADFTTTKYTYSGDVVAVGAVLIKDRYLDMGVGTTTFGIFAGGESGGVVLTQTDKYTYSGDTTAASTALSAAKSRGGAAVGNAIGAVFSGGLNVSSAQVATSSKMTYSGFSVGSATSLASSTRLYPGQLSTSPGGF